jgi:hypothetical protein
VRRLSGIDNDLTELLRVQHVVLGRPYLAGFASLSDDVFYAAEELSQRLGLSQRE